MSGRSLNSKCSAYDIQSQLLDYNDMVKYMDEYSVSLEDQLLEEINVFYPEMSYELEKLFEFVHEEIDKGILDTNEVEEKITSLISLIGHYSDRRENMKRACRYESHDYSIIVKGINYILQNSLDNKEYEREDEYENNEGYKGIIKEQAAKIYDIIVKSEGPVTKEYLGTVIEKLHDQAVFLATSNNCIINYRGLYISDSNIDFSDNEKKEIAAAIEEQLNRKSLVHAQELYEDIKFQYRDFMRRAYIKTAYHLFSFLQHYYSKDFSFGRPFIAKIGTKIAPMEQVKSFLEDYDEISLDEYFEFLKENHIKIYTIIDSIEQLKDTFVLKNKTQLIKIEKIGINQNVIQKILELIQFEVFDNKCMAIRDLECICDFPRIDVPWDEWLIFSLIRKYGKKIDAILTSNQYKTAIPIICESGYGDPKKIESIAQRYHGYESMGLDNGNVLDDFNNDELDDELLLLEDE